ncbi:MAG: tripartite tricarboxylate transporter permease [Desulfurococcaceae archaeon]
MIEFIGVISYGLLGVLVGSALSWLPGLHIFNILAFLVAIGLTNAIPDVYFPYFSLGALISYSYLYIIPTTYFSVAEESTVLLLFPTQRYLLSGRADEAVLLYIIGAIIGSLYLTLFSPLLLYLVPIIYNIYNSFISYLIIGIVVFWFMAEWPRKGDRGSPARRLWDAYQQIIGGVLVFIMAGLLGIIANYTSILPPQAGYARLTPLFIGCFGMPWVLQNFIMKRKVPKQEIFLKAETSISRVAWGAASGLIGGTIAAVFPIITGGMGGLIAGHMTSTRGDDAFVISQGVNRVVYYVGAFYLLFLPFSRLVRGATAWITQAIYMPKTWLEFYYAIFIILLASGIAALFTIFLSKFIASSIHRISYKALSIGLVTYLTLITYVITGFNGVLLMIIATFIGLATILFNTRRSYPLAVLIVPVLASWTGTVEFWLKLIGR